MGSNPTTLISLAGSSIGRTPPSQGGKAGSIPALATRNKDNRLAGCWRLSDKQIEQGSIPWLSIVKKRFLDKHVECVIVCQ